MGAKRSGQPRRPVRDVDEVPSAAAAGGWRGWLLETLAGAAVSPILRLFAAILLGFAALFLVLAWQIGPQPALDAMRFAAFTARTDARIVDSWVAVEFDPAQMGTHRYWRPFAKASPCLVAEYAGDWGPAARRAFCGNRFTFDEAYALHDLDQLAPDVPFAWQRDERGFAVPQIRLGAAANAWLAAHAPADTFMLGDPPPATELAALRFAFDLPLDDAIAGLDKPLPAFPLAFDPRDPAGAMPAGFVAAHRHPDTAWRWILALIVAAIGVRVWSAGMSLLLAGLPRHAMLFAGALPLLALPWWGSEFPRALAHLDAPFASVIADMFADLDRTGRLIASAPDEATLVDGEKVVWRVGEGIYADTLGRIRFAAPAAPLPDGDAALARIAATVTAQVQALDAAERAALFKRLRDDKRSGRTHAGIAFVPAARAALLDAQDPPAVRDAAKRFLIEWTTQPVEPVGEHAAGYRERARLEASLADVPVPEIANVVRRHLQAGGAAH